MWAGGNILGKPMKSGELRYDIATVFVVTQPPKPPPGIDWKDVWDIAAHIGTLIGLLVAGVWGYFNFIRSRTYYPRMELGVTGEIRSKDGYRFLVPRITLKNIGNSQIRLVQEGSGYKIFFATGKVDSNGELGWSKGEQTYEMFTDHNWIEPGESIFDERSVIPVPVDCIAVKIFARLVAPVGWPQKTNNAWKCSAVISPAEPKKG